MGLETSLVSIIGTLIVLLLSWLSLSLRSFKKETREELKLLGNKVDCKFKDIKEDLKYKVSKLDFGEVKNDLKERISEKELEECKKSCHGEQGKITEDQEKLWNRIYRHGHTETGKVIITET